MEILPLNTKKQKAEEPDGREHQANPLDRKTAKLLAPVEVPRPEQLARREDQGRQHVHLMA